MLTLNYRYRIYPNANQQETRVHQCQECGYTTDRDTASGQVIKNRGIELISTAGLAGMETACEVGLPGIEATQSRQVAKPPERSRRGKTRKAKS